MVRCRRINKRHSRESDSENETTNWTSFQRKRESHYYESFFFPSFQLFWPTDFYYLGLSAIGHNSAAVPALRSCSATKPIHKPSAGYPLQMSEANSSRQIKNKYARDNQAARELKEFYWAITNFIIANAGWLDLHTQAPTQTLLRPNVDRSLWICISSDLIYKRKFKIIIEHWTGNG